MDPVRLTVSALRVEPMKVCFAVSTGHHGMAPKQMSKEGVRREFRLARRFLQVIYSICKLKPQTVSPSTPFSLANT